jgi:branched-chain amino acid transport system permease protein
MAQLIVNILLSSVFFALLAISILLSYQTAKFFHFAHAVVITSGAYLTYLFFIQLKWYIWVAIPLSIVISILITIFIELYIYKPLRKQNTSSWKMLIASLGIYIALQNIISLIWGDGSISIRTLPVKSGYNFFGAYITDTQIITLVISIVCVFSILIIIHSTKLGKQIRAVSSNEELSNIFGISSDRIILCSFIFGSALASIAGILSALDTDIMPTMGFHVFLYGVIVMIIGGIENYYGILGGALLLSITQNLSAYFFDSKWIDTTTYTILILFLIWKPFGFSGKYQRKIQI